MSGPVRFLLNEELVETRVPGGRCLLDLVREEKGLRGTKEGCKEGDCGACVVLVGDLLDDGRVDYRPVTSCLVPVAELGGRHVVTIEGLDLGVASTVQRLVAEEGATQCGFCTPGIVVSLTAQLMAEGADLGRRGVRRALSGHLCRCTGYRSLRLASQRAFTALADSTGVAALVAAGQLPAWFLDVPDRLRRLREELGTGRDEQTPPGAATAPVVAGGTDLLVQRGEALATSPVRSLLAGRGAPSREAIRLEPGPDGGREIVFGARTTFEQLLSDPLLGSRLARWPDHLELMGSWQIRNRATIGGNLVNASPIGDGTILLLALGAAIVLEREGRRRRLALEDFYRGYKKIDLEAGEDLVEVRIPDVLPGDAFDYEKVSKRRWLDIASVCSALRLRLEGDRIVAARLAVGGVAPVPLFLARTSAALVGGALDHATLAATVRAAQDEIAPIGDVRGSERAKRLWVRQLLAAHFGRLAPDRFAAWAPIAAPAGDPRSAPAP